MSIFRRTPAGTLRTRTAAVLGTLALTTSGLVGLSAGPANAIPRTNYCGSSYGFLKSWPISWRGQSGGYIDVYYNSSNGYNCVIARTNDSVISSAWDIVVAARKSGGTWQTDGDKPGQNFTKYAGPLYVYAPNSCIDISGSFDTSGGGGATGYDRVHCG
ncbi:hypothetical protein C5N14_22255 [Micromonospora sp. MW-13]|uniref:spore-associated protein A n=1 Tax=Micromonospora sp. MW-13 TaxID=2094022 RepID=UPI000E44E018|nr:spore-associated protein A [Micromonospora sp. MW-13]RGC66792.1 hypothetical protein C5N14_22255 [Micromonospora sp. MW-13]